MDPSARTKRVAVTGAGGFLGPWVVEGLAREGCLVQAIIGPPNEPAKTPSGAAYVAQADICDSEQVRRLIAGSEVVVHLAGPASVAASFEDPARYVRVHTEGTATLLQACRAEGVRKVVYVSSAEVYGQPDRSPVPEDAALSARSFYGAAKIGAEKLIEAGVHAFALRGVILRPFSVYGPGASPVALIPRIIGLARQGESVTLRDLRPVRDYCFVGDVADAVVRACFVQRDELDVFNVGTMTGTSVQRVAELVVGLFGLDTPIRETGDRDRPGKSEIYELIADNRRAQARLGWTPKVSLEEGLRRTIAGTDR